MSFGLMRHLRSFFNVDPHERLKMVLLTVAFLFVMGGYAVVKDLKNAIFVVIVGKSYLPLASFLSVVVLTPAILLYSRLVDTMRRFQLVYFYSLVYGIVGMVFAYFVGHPIIGMSNTDSSPYRLLGWLFYFFIEGYTPFLISVFWAFANSITAPDAAKNNYGFIVAGSKIGGIASILLTYLILEGAVWNWWSETSAHQMGIALSALMSLSVAVVIAYLMRAVPGRYLHGYEAAYRFEKEQQQSRHKHDGILGGLALFFKYPYILGIFGMVAFFEMTSKILSYQQVSIAYETAHSISAMSTTLLNASFWIHFSGLFMSILGTRTLLKLLGERRCLLLVPLFTAVLIVYFMLSQSSYSIMIILIALRSLNYAFTQPVREALYIPTVKEIKFKSKSWIDAFGGKLAKSLGSTCNMVIEGAGAAATVPLMGVFFAVIVGLWLGTAYFLGRRFEYAVEHNEVIGAGE